MKRVFIPAEELEEVQERLHTIEKLLLAKNGQVSDPVYDTEGLMKLLNVSRRTVQQWRDQRFIEFSAVGGKFYYRLSAVNKMLDQHLQKTEGLPWK